MSEYCRVPAPPAVTDAHSRVWKVERSGVSLSAAQVKETKASARPTETHALAAAKERDMNRMKSA